jgi:hypothetical protein
MDFANYDPRTLANTMEARTRTKEDKIIHQDFINFDLNLDFGAGFDFKKETQKDSHTMVCSPQARVKYQQ